jgi:hypothetical protein
MQVVEVPQSVPQAVNETAEKPQASGQEQAVKEEESRNIIRQIRNITAFGDCV